MRKCLIHSFVMLLTLYACQKAEEKQIITSTNNSNDLVASNIALDMSKKSSNSTLSNNEQAIIMNKEIIVDKDLKELNYKLNLNKETKWNLLFNEQNKNLKESCVLKFNNIKELFTANSNDFDKSMLVFSEEIKINFINEYQLNDEQKKELLEIAKKQGFENIEKVSNNLSFDKISIIDNSFSLFLDKVKGIDLNTSIQNHNKCLANFLVDNSCNLSIANICDILNNNYKLIASRKLNDTVETPININIITDNL